MEIQGVLAAGCPHWFPWYVILFIFCFQQIAKKKMKRKIKIAHDSEQKKKKKDL